MGLRDDQAENDRIAARNAKIKQLLAREPQGDSSESEPLDWTPEPNKAESKAEQKAAQPPSPKTAPYVGRPLMPWEVLVKGRPIQYRPMTSREVEAMDEKTMMENIKRQDQAHERKVQAAIRERDAEQKDMDKRHAHEKKTGRRPYGEKRFIPLEQAIREGYVGQASSSNNNGRPEWWSEKNPDGIMGQG